MGNYLKGNVNETKNLERIRDGFPAPKWISLGQAIVWTTWNWQSIKCAHMRIYLCKTWSSDQCAIKLKSTWTIRGSIVISLQSKTHFRRPPMSYDLVDLAHTTSCNCPINTHLTIINKRRMRSDPKDWLGHPRTHTYTPITVFWGGHMILRPIRTPWPTISLLIIILSREFQPHSGIPILSRFVFLKDKSDLGSSRSKSRTQTTFFLP